MSVAGHPPSFTRSGSASRSPARPGKLGASGGDVEQPADHLVGDGDHRGVRAAKAACASIWPTTDWTARSMLPVGPTATGSQRRSAGAVAGPEAGRDGAVEMAFIARGPFLPLLRRDRPRMSRQAPSTGVPPPGGVVDDHGGDSPASAITVHSPRRARPSWPARYRFPLHAHEANSAAARPRSLIVATVLLDRHRYGRGGAGLGRVGDGRRGLIGRRHLEGPHHRA